MATPRKPQGPRRPVVGSRNPTSRPRTVAGRRDDAPPASGADEASYADEQAPPPPPPGDEPPAPELPEEEPRAEGPVDAPAGERPAAAALGSSRTTLVLVVALVVLVLGAAAMGWYLWGASTPTVSSDRPVVIGEVAHRSAVETAQRSTEEILTYGYQDFDAEVEAAQDKMTPQFAEQFAQTAADVKDRFVQQRTEQEVKVVAASVVLASPEKVQALLFLDQYVIRQGEGTSITPYRALVTLEREDGGWLVGNIETR